MGNPASTYEVIGVRPDALGEGVLGRAVSSNDLTKRKRRVHANVTSTLRGLRRLNERGFDAADGLESLYASADLIARMYLKVSLFSCLRVFAV